MAYTYLATARLNARPRLPPEPPKKRQAPPTEEALAKAMAQVARAEGVRPWGKRVKVAGRLQYAMINDALFDLCQRADDPLSVIRDHVVKPEEVMGATM